MMDTYLRPGSSLARQKGEGRQPAYLHWGRWEEGVLAIVLVPCIT